MLKIRVVFLLPLICNLFFLSCNVESNIERTIEFTPENYSLNRNGWKEIKFKKFSVFIPKEWNIRDVPNPQNTEILGSFFTNCSVNSKFNIVRKDKELFSKGDILENYSSQYYSGAEKFFDKIYNYDYYKLNWKEESSVLGFFEGDKLGRRMVIYVFFIFIDSKIYDFSFITEKNSSCDVQMFNKIIFNSKLNNQKLLKSNIPPSSVEQLVISKPLN